MTTHDNKSRADVAYAGITGAFAEEAAVRFLSESASQLACSSFYEVVEAVDSGRARFGVLPTENRIAGPVAEAVRLLSSRPLRVVRELDLAIELVLVGPARIPVGEIREALSHPMALAQCSRFFSEHPHIEAVSSTNTAVAVMTVLAAKNATRTAIGSRRAAFLHGGMVLKVGIEDARPNFTRFVLVTARPSGGVAFCNETDCDFIEEP